MSATQEFYFPATARTCPRAGVASGRTAPGQWSSWYTALRSMWDAMITLPASSPNTVFMSAATITRPRQDSALPGGAGYTCRQDGWTHMVDDLHTLRRLTEKKYPGIPYLLLGHSMGSFPPAPSSSAVRRRGCLRPFPAPDSSPPAGGLRRAVRKPSGGVWEITRSALIQKLCFGAYNNHSGPSAPPTTGSAGTKRSWTPITPTPSASSGPPSPCSEI